MINSYTSGYPFANRYQLSQCVEDIYNHRINPSYLHKQTFLRYFSQFFEALDSLYFAFSLHHSKCNIQSKGVPALSPLKKCINHTLSREVVTKLNPGLITIVPYQISSGRVNCYCCCCFCTFCQRSQIKSRSVKVEIL